MQGGGALSQPVPLSQSPFPAYLPSCLLVPWVWGQATRRLWVAPGSPSSGWSSGSSLACLPLPRGLAASIGILISGQPVFSWPGAGGRITDPVSAPVASLPALGPPGAYGVRAAALPGFGGASSVILEGLGVWKGPLLAL